jgi:hypothetical protein
MITDRGKFAAAALAVAALAGAPAVATADTPRSQLPACGGATDPSGDEQVGFAGNFTPAPGDPGLDMTATYFTPHVDPDGNPTGLQVTVDVPGLSNTPPPYGLGDDFRLFYTDSDGTARYLEVEAYGTAMSAVLGSEFWDEGTEGSTGPSSDGTASGEFVTGPNGHITFNVPDAVDQTGRITDIHWQAATDEGAVVASQDVLPDGSDTLDYNGAKCPPVVDPPVDG